MNCLYYYTTISRGSESRRYMERMNEDGDVVPIFEDGIVYVTLLDDKHYAITNNLNEVFCIGNDGTTGVDKFLSQVKQNAVIVNGDDYSDYLAKQKKKAEALTNEQTE